MAAGSTRLIIVTGYRDDCLRSLKALSHQANPDPFIRMLDRAHRFVSQLPFDDYGRTVELLESTGALDDSGDARLRLPSELPEAASMVAPPAWRAGPR